jgi:hypothetical protein
MSKRKHHSRRTTGERYALVPIEVLLSPACSTLPHFAFRLLVAIAAQYNGRNNGDLCMTWDICRTFGITSKGNLVDGLALLIRRGLIVKTRQGGKRPAGPCLYAVTWKPIDERAGGYECGIVTTFKAANNWVDWNPADGTDGSPVKASAKRGFSSDRFGTRGRLTGLDSLPDGTDGSPVTGLELPNFDENGPVNGTDGSPPSESLPGGSTCIGATP